MPRHATILVLVGILASGCNEYALEEMDYPARSMEPTIKAGSKVTVDLQAYDGRDPRRFDIVVFTPPDAPDSRYGFRIAGLPGEQLEIVNGGLRIDGTLIKHPEGIQLRKSRSGKHGGAKLAPNQYFLLGDNAGNARDSRHFGPVARSAIHGKIIKIAQVVGLDAE